MHPIASKESKFYVEFEKEQVQWNIFNHSSYYSKGTKKTIFHLQKKDIVAPSIRQPECTDWIKAVTEAKLI